jgi:lambda repressor-like predicted transcriptional regulator
MEPQEIKALIREKGFSLALIAEQINKSPNALSGVIHRRTTSTVIASAIAKVIGLPITQVFPDVRTYTNPVHLRDKKLRKQKSEELAMLLAS